MMNNLIYTEQALLLLYFGNLVTPLIEETLITTCTNNKNHKDYAY